MKKIFHEKEYYGIKQVYVSMKIIMKINLMNYVCVMKKGVVHEIIFFNKEMIFHDIAHL